MSATKLDPILDSGVLAIAVRVQGTTTTITPRGEWCFAEQSAARSTIQAALERTPETVVLDLSHLSFIDTSGMHDIMDLHERSTQQSMRLVIIPGPRAVQRPFELLELTDKLPFLTGRTDLQTSAPRLQARTI